MLHEASDDQGRKRSRIPIAEGLYTWPSDEPQLIASRCKACGEVAFPAQSGCATIDQRLHGNHVRRIAFGGMR